MTEVTCGNDSGPSPFDAIRQVHADGTEFWSARDLMPLLGYDKWERFADAIERAIASMTAQGHDPQVEASRLREPFGRTNQMGENFHLSRFGAYLVAMNGDPRKPEVAAAQAYFAIRTRHAETQLPELTPELLMAKALKVADATIQRTAAQLAQAESEVAELKPRAIVADRMLDASGDLSIADAAKELCRAGLTDCGERRLFKALETRRWIYRGKGDGKWRVYQSAIEAGYMSVLPQSHYHPKTGELVLDVPQPRITPKGVQRYLLEHGVAEYQIALPDVFEPAIGGQS
ncbi:phage antirepressor KilAC domain-containing protein [Nakamurella aerolata]|uniref:Antirepressor protein C-terminal domain-containing protein n=1 Tax=Nakamurella aerolata TaxID=1656892 RepID=A0A849A8Q1_9ACTN|nr:phage antirepressor KilAC domain-containing protein [Nakamurella aerolata]NNG36905.1 hypothetical protein [Nakamurella aerolata]